GRDKEMRLSGLAPRLEVVIRGARQLLEEGDDRPDLLVRHLDRAEARHAGHLDAVLDHPEQLPRLALVDDVLEVGRSGIQAFRELRPLDARPAVAVYAAAGRAGPRARLDRRRIA